MDFITTAQATSSDSHQLSCIKADGRAIFTTWINRSAGMIERQSFPSQDEETVMKLSKIKISTKACSHLVIKKDVHDRTTCPIV